MTQPMFAKQWVVQGKTRLADLYLGLLYALDDMAVYGFCTNTHTKFLLILRITADSAAVKDQEIRGVRN